MHTAALQATPLRFMPAAILARTATTAAPLKTQCSTCHLKDLCLPCGLTGSDVQRLDGLMFARRRVKEGEALYHEGDRFQFIYAVRSGTFKSHLALRDGREQVTGFQMAGELLGLDGLASGNARSPMPTSASWRRAAPTCST
jgi:CRP/FNR family transcriptional regulator